MSNDKRAMSSAALLLIALVASPLGVIANAAADTPRCVSKREFSRIHLGMGQPRVHRIFDTAGAFTGLGAPNSIYHYRSCGSGGGSVQISYDTDLRVVSKAGSWFS